MVIKVVGNTDGLIVVWDPKNENETPDLRLDDPFEELVNGLDGFDEVTAPFPVILLKTRKWFVEKYGKIPESREEREMFKDYIKSHFDCDLENVQEALHQAYRVWNPLRMGPVTRELIQRQASGTFWTLLKALGQFVELHQKWPLNGGIPDMHSKSEDYIRLQKIYQLKAQKDLEEFSKLVEGVAPARIKEFCKNCLGVRYLEFPRLENLNPKQSNNLTQFFLGCIVADRFMDDTQRSPGKKLISNFDIKEIPKMKFTLILEG